MERSGLRKDRIQNRPRLTGARAIASIAALVAAALIFASSEGGAAGGNTYGGSLLEMAPRRFPGLTRAERALLVFADDRRALGPRV